MYGETGILFPFFQNFDQEAQLLEDFCNQHNTSPSLNSTMFEYYLGGEGDLLKSSEEMLGTISCREGCNPSDIESFQDEQPLNQVLYKDLLGKAARDDLLSCAQFQKSVSSSFLNFHGMDFGSVFGMRRAYREGDVKTLGYVNEDGNTNLNPSSSIERSLVVRNCTPEERKEKISRYRIKKTKRNFDRKIKYACRKALADSQPRIRGRFAKTEES